MIKFINFIVSRNLHNCKVQLAIDPNQGYYFFVTLFQTKTKIRKLFKVIYQTLLCLFSNLRPMFEYIHIIANYNKTKFYVKRTYDPSTSVYGCNKIQKYKFYRYCVTHTNSQDERNIKIHK